MKLHKLLLLLFIQIPIIGLSQRIDELSLQIGFRFNSYEILETSSFSEKNDSEEIGLHLGVHGRSYLEDSRRFALTYGFGVQRNFINLQPFAEFKEIDGLTDIRPDTLFVFKVRNWDWQFMIPIGVSFEIFDQKDIYPPFLILPGLRIIAGLKYEFTFKRINTTSLILEEYDVNRIFPDRITYQDPEVQARTDDFFSEQIKRYQLRGSIGIELFVNYGSYGGFVGFTYNPRIISPLTYKVAGSNPFAGYLGIYFDWGN